MEEVTPRENPWFSPSVRYEGTGRADFANNRGAAEGDVRAFFDEVGGSRIEMEVKRLDSTEALRDGIWELTASERIAQPTGELVLDGLMGNPCTQLTVQTSTGVFSSAERIDYRLRSGPDGEWTDRSGSDGEWIDLHLWRSQFERHEARPAKYWVLPLLNFVSEFCCLSNAVDSHPLRIFPTPAIPPGLSEDEFLLASLQANSRNHLVNFTFNGAPAFIEPLADYHERKKKLTGGLVPRLTTAVMVGEIGGNPIDRESLDSWFPIDLLRVLGFATGSEVGAPWIEFRDESGALVRRIHEPHGSAVFTEGHRTIRETIHRGTGRILTCFLSSEHVGKSYVPVAMSHAIQGGCYSGLTMEEKLIYVVRGLDCLCDYFGLTEQYPAKRLQAEKRELVKEILDKAAQQIRSLAGAPKTPTDKEDFDALHKIADRAKVTPLGKTRDFGLALLDLLKMFELRDATVVDPHYRKKTASAGVTRSWASDLSHLRGAPIHGGFFDIEGGEFKLEDIVAVTRHLHDILVRVILKMIKYDGTYQPRVITGTTM